MLTKLRKVLLVVCCLMLCASGSAYIYFWSWLHTGDDTSSGTIHYKVAKGSSLYRVAYDLRQMEIVRWPKLWAYYAKLTGQTHIKAGEYQFDRSLSPRAILVKFNEGEVVQYQITLIEGLRFSDFVAEIHKHKKIIKTFDVSNSLDVIKSLGIPAEHPEGWFYPDTYRYSAGDTDIALLKRAKNKLVAVLEQEWQTRSSGLPYEDSYQALIMASIIEKETGVGYERGQIAGVFVRRLKIGMRLQTDPTVIYGMGERYQGDIKRKDLKRPTPYNTYVIRGLPPTPIAMVGRHAIHAALHPTEGTSLYFVAKGDGTHYFSDTVEEHNRAVVEYQKKRRKDYRSTPSRQTEVNREG